MRLLSIVTLLAMGCVSGMARAEFSLQATPSSPLPRPASGPPPASHPMTSSEKTRTVVASDFGHGVPLRFAVRQLLPKNWHVRYGQGVDPDRPVNWEGGRPWDFVLRDAVKPLGLQASAAPGEANVVQITR